MYDDFLSPLGIAAAQAAYSECDEWLDQLKIYLDDNFKFLSKFLPESKFNIPDATYLAWIDISAYTNMIAQDKQDNLALFFAENAGVLIEGGNMFVNNGDGFIRINLACPKQVLEQGLKRIANVLVPNH